MCSSWFSAHWNQRCCWGKKTAALREIRYRDKLQETLIDTAKFLSPQVFIVNRGVCAMLMVAQRISL